MKSMLILPAFLLASAAVAGAGDVANVEVLGFSETGGVFAFEEYGVQDGSGFPYTNRFYIDTTDDVFVPGTPIRVRIDDEAASVEDARAAARSQGEAVVPESILSAHVGFTAGWSPVTELSADPYRMAVNPRPVVPPIDAPVEFRLEEIPLQAPEGCEEFGPVVGFRLLRIDARDGGRTEIVHEDDAVPGSRNCPTGYRIGGIQTFHPDVGDPVFAVMIAIRSRGFEGPDHRWLAVTDRVGG